MTHERRKADHIRINLEEEVQFPRLTTGFERYRLQHQALPELDLRAVNTRVELLGKSLRLPLLISSMTGGTTAAAAINRNLALGAQLRGIAMGLGSQRAGLEQPETDYTFRVRDAAPDILLFANLGAVQLNRSYGVDHCRRAVDMIGADALILHLNPLQEALQADGDWDWRGLLGKVESVCRELGVPVVVKEVAGASASSLLAAWQRPEWRPSMWLGQAALPGAPSKAIGRRAKRGANSAWLSPIGAYRLRRRCKWRDAVRPAPP
jgi:isopentenyl-diphosphate Delta-isomerase